MNSNATAERAAVTVIGLGAMGRALATAFLAAGHPTTVWNRTSGRADALVANGATAASSVADAIARSSVTVVCVLDPAAVAAVLDDAGDALDGATVVNLTSSVPGDAERLGERATGAGARYLDGKIMVPTPLIGTADGLVIYSGDRSVFDEHVETLRAIGGGAEHLGDDAGLAAVHDLGMLDIFFNGMAAFLHAAALVGAHGVRAADFLAHARQILTVLDGTIVQLAEQVDADRHPGDEDNLVMEEAALAHIVEASAAAGVDTTVPDTVRALAKRAIAAGYGDVGFSRVIDVLREPARVG